MAKFKLSKLYTRGGDDGTTGLIGGDRVQKNNLQVEAYGTTDELNSWLGLVSAEASERSLTELPEILIHIQQELFDIGAELATPPDSEWLPPSQITEADVARLEGQIDEWTADVPELKSFLLPGGSKLTSSIHIARTVCRRAERVVSSLNESITVRPEVISYLNRLSDWLFALARHIAHQTGEEEPLWDSERKKS